MANNDRIQEIERLCYQGSFLEAEEKINTLLQEDVSDEEKIKAKILRGEIRLHQGRFVEAVKVFEKVYKRGKEINFIEGINNSYGGLGLANYYLGNYDKAEEIFKEVNDPNGLGWVYLDRGIYGEAEKYFNQGIKSSSKVSPKIGVANNQIGLGWVRYYRGKYKEANDYFKKLENLKDEYRIGYLQSLVGRAWIKFDQAKTEEDYKKVEEEFEKIFEKAKEWGYVVIRVLSLNGIGWALTGQKKFDKAIRIHRIADEISEIFGYKYGRILSFIGLIHIYGDPHGRESCEGFLNESQKVFEKFDKDFKISHLNVLKLVGEGWGKWKETNYQNSKELFEKAYQISKGQGYVVGQIHSLYGRGWSFFKQGEDYESGKKFFEEAIKSIKQVGYSYRGHLIDETYFKFASKKFLKLFKEVAESKKNRDEEFRFEQGRSSQKDENFLLFLRRWNSFTPILRRGRETNVGGGYFLYWQKKGIVIDPGHNFLENLTKQGLSIADIDVVIVTHLHLDHTDDLLPLLDLLYQYNEYLERQDSESKIVDFYMNRTTFSMFGDLLGSSKYATPHLLDAKEKEPSKTKIHDVEIKVIPTFHKELLGGQEGIGLILNLCEGDDSRHQISFTGDTGWQSTYPYTQFSKTDLLVVHIGSLKEEEFDDEYYYENHLGGKGALKLCTKLIEEYVDKLKFIIFSEFGEEFSGMRKDIVNQIKEGVKKNLPQLSSSIKTKFIPADLGLKVRFRRGKIEVLCTDEDEPIVKAGVVTNFTEMIKDLGSKIHYKCRNHPYIKEGGK